MRLSQVLTFIVAVSLGSLVSCGEEKEACAPSPDISNSLVELKIESYESVLPTITTKQELINFLTQQPDIRDYFFNRTAYPNDSIFIDELFHRFTNPYIDSLLFTTQNEFGDLSKLDEELVQAFGHLKYYYPEFQPPKVKTIISGLETDIFVSDSLVIIGLDYYLGPKSKYKPNMYDYMARRYQQNFIVPSIMLLYGIDSRFNNIDLNDRTVLAEMIAYGKAYYFAKQMQPCIPDSVLIGYTSEEMRGSRENEDLIWKRLVQDEVFFSTSHLIKQRYLAERPKTLEVGEKCPGRIGTWVGWQIVKKYAEKNPEKSLSEIMQMSDAQEIFRESGYKPSR